MTRLADALDRANRAPDVAPQGAAPPAAAPAADRNPSAHSHGHRLKQAAAVAPRHAVPSAPPAGGASLLGMPEEGNTNSAWRTDPQLVGKLLGTDGFSGAALEQYRKLAATLHH